MIKYLLLVALVLLRIFFHSGNKSNTTAPFTSLRPNTNLNVEHVGSQSTYSKIYVHKPLNSPQPVNKY